MVVPDKLVVTPKPEQKKKETNERRKKQHAQ